MLNGFGFRRKMYYLCTSEEENAHRQRVFSSFFIRKLPKNHCFTKHVGISTYRSGFSTCFCEFFLGEVGARNDDIGFPKVKRYLFFNPAFLTFQGNVKVSFQGNILHVACGRVAQRKWYKNRYNKDQDILPCAQCSDRMKNKKIRCESRKGIQVK